VTSSTTPVPLPEHSLSSATLALGETIRAFHASLVGAERGSGEPGWREHLRGLLEPLQTAFTQHRDLTEGEHGLYAVVLGDAPRLVHAVNGLLTEHRQLDDVIRGLVDSAAGSVGEPSTEPGAGQPVESGAADLHGQALDLLNNLSRHRQHDADLLHEAYGTDIGGE
jgi:hypothetical protein